MPSFFAGGVWPAPRLASAKAVAPTARLPTKLRRERERGRSGFMARGPKLRCSSFDGQADKARAPPLGREKFSPFESLPTRRSRIQPFAAAGAVAGFGSPTGGGADEGGRGLPSKM